MQWLEEITQTFDRACCGVSSVKELKQLQIEFLGKKGRLSNAMDQLRNAPVDEKPKIGQAINRCKEYISDQLQNRLHALEKEEEKIRLAREGIDVSLPGRKRRKGNCHIIQRMLDDMTAACVEMGFAVQEGPIIESEHYNFSALNFAPDHPAREMQDTFYLSSSDLLRTHTSNIQIRAMEKASPPIRIISPGRVFRNEDISARCHVFFHQLEGLYIDRHVSFLDLKATLEHFFHLLLGPNTQLRLRLSYFPFVEPGVEVDMSCFLCKKKGCAICKETGWVEIAGAGLVHPNVLKSGNIDSEHYSGYAWGMGVERLAMMKYGIDDIRLFTLNDASFLSQFYTRWN